MFSPKATILCIDDHWNGLIGRKMLLEENGYKVLEASGGLEGLADRVGALDGTFTIQTTSGGGTTIHAEIPCALS